MPTPTSTQVHPGEDQSYLRSAWWEGAMSFVRGASPPDYADHTGEDPVAAARARGYAETRYRFHDLGFRHVRADAVQVGWYVARQWRPTDAQQVMFVEAKNKLHIKLAPSPSGRSGGMRVSHDDLVLAGPDAPDPLQGPPAGIVAGRPGTEVLGVAPCRFVTHDTEVPVVVYREAGQLRACSVSMWYQVTGTAAPAAPDPGDDLEV